MVMGSSQGHTEFWKLEQKLECFILMEKQHASLKITVTQPPQW